MGFDWALADRFPVLGLQEVGGNGGRETMRRGTCALWATIIGAMIAPSVAGAEDFDNASVIALTRAGIGPDVILAKIGGLPCGYDVSTDAIVELKGAGVADRVIAAMVDRCTGATRAQGAAMPDAPPMTKRMPGLYIDMGHPGAHRIERIRPTVASGGRATGNGSILFPYRITLAIPRTKIQANTQDPQPTFYFYFETDDGNVGAFGTSATVSAQSPAEFSLIRFRLKDGQREMVVGKQSILRARIGIDPKDAIQVASDEIDDGIFRVRATEPMSPGSYGFVLRAGSDVYRIYDFTIL